MAYSFFPNDFNKTPNLQDQLFLMKQKQAAALNEANLGSERQREAYDARPTPKLDLSAEFIARIPPSRTPPSTPAPTSDSKLNVPPTKYDHFTPSSKQKQEYSHTVYPWQRAKTVREAGSKSKFSKPQDDYMDEDESKLSPEVKADKERYLRLKAEKEERRLNKPVNAQRSLGGGSDPEDKDIDEYKKYDVYKPVFEPKRFN